MTPEEINIAIAKACGFSVGEKDSQGLVEVFRDGKFKSCFAAKRIPNPDLSVAYKRKCLPDYYHDLNACAEMEKTISGKFNNDPQAEYRWALVGMLNTKEWGFATAPQRCEAFLRVKELWRD